MKKLLVALAIASTLPISVQANATPEGDLELCYYLAEFAEVIMEYRQKGVSMPTQMKTVPQEGEKGQILRAMVEYAYEHPFWSTPENKQRAVTEFTDDVFRLCVKEEN